MEMDRIKKLNSIPVLIEKKYILYWVHSSQRSNFNPSLDYSIELSNTHKKPLLAFFGLKENYPESNERHFKFMLEGLKELKDKLLKIGIPFLIIKGDPCEICEKLALDASAVVIDKAYLKIEKTWNKMLAQSIRCALFEVESNLVVPVETASKKEEYSAATLRRKITPLLDNYLIKSKSKILKIHSLNINIKNMEILSLENTALLAENLNIDHSVQPVRWIKGGEASAKKLLDYFILNKLDKYSENRNDPCLDWLSNMSPYLHFGNISPVDIAISIINSKNQRNEESVNAYLEELIIRRELAFNFVYYNNEYNEYNKMTSNWAKQTLEAHKNDSREYIYSIDQLEYAKTYDSYWNAAQTELLKKGKIHSYMRMYWCKKIIEWTSSPREAYDYSIYLNNKYSIDGRDPNSFAGIAWCFGKHDRAWKERKIFGKVRYMSQNGLKKKFDIDLYVKK